MTTLNRTRLELKHASAVLEKEVLIALNRTRLELKLTKMAAIAVRQWALNRTRLELKPSSTSHRSGAPKRLIAPDWN